MSSESKRDWRFRIEDMIQAAQEAVDFTAKVSITDFLENVVLYRASTACFTVLGEAANHIPQSIQQEFLDIPWEQVVGMRNHLVHGYYRTDSDTVYETIKKDLPNLIIQLRRILIKYSPDKP